MTHNQLTEEEQRAGWRLLFDGKTLDGWQATGKPEGWQVSEESILCTAQGGLYLTTVDRFENFLLSLEFRIEPQGNSGVFIRWSDLADPVHTGLEIQILDSYGTEKLVKNTCGAIYGLVAPTTDPFKPAGGWNHYLIKCEGPLVSVELNGQHVAEADIDQWTEPGQNPDGTTNKFRYAWNAMPRLGHIGLQEHDGKVWFRNIRIKEL